MDRKDLGHHKVCLDCETELPITEFRLQKGRNGKMYRTSYCKRCMYQRQKVSQVNSTGPSYRVWYKMRRKYGSEISWDDWKAAWITGREQGCAICGSKESLCLDHCHTQDKVREVLCQACNKGLGFFRDDPERMLKAIEYLRKHGGNA